MLRINLLVDELAKAREALDLDALVLNADDAFILEV
jgi:hypothetical protein